MNLFPYMFVSSRLWSPMLPRILEFLSRFEREMSLGQLVWLCFLMYSLFQFLTGRVCETRRNSTDPNVDLPAGMPRGKKPRHKIWKRNMRQYYLMRRTRRRPVVRPVRDPIRKWYRPETWRWRRRVPTDARKHKSECWRPRSRPRVRSRRTPFSGTKRSAYQSRRQRKRKKNKLRKQMWREMRRRPPRSDPEWDSESSPEERFESVRTKLLHVPDVMFGFQYGIDLDEYVSRLDPIKQFRTLRELSGIGFIHTTRSTEGARTGSSRFQRRALIAAAHLTNTLPTSLQFSNEQNTLDVEKLPAHELAELTRNRSVYFSNKPDDLPIVIDTGGTRSVTPVPTDFVGELQIADTEDLQGLSASTPVKGVGTVEWTVKDVFGTVRTFRTTAYYVPDAEIRLFSPQQFFQEQQAGELWCNHQRTVLTLPEGTDLEFPYNPGSNLPMMLPDQRMFGGVSIADAYTIMGAEPKDYMSVAHDLNRNLTASQKELLTWHWKLGHAHCAWIQRLASVVRKPPDGIEVPILKTKEKRVSACQRPFCTACQMAKQTRKSPGVSIEKPIPDKEMLLRRGKLKPGEQVSIDQYESALPGRLPHTKGKEPKRDKYVGGTLFVDHATAHIFLRHQTNLKVHDTLRSKHAFERFAAEHGVKIKSYRADNAPFAAKEFQADLDAKGQTITYSGTGAHFQNGVAERAIQTVTSWARAMLLHAVLNWPDQADLSLWPFALEYAVYLWNTIPNKESLVAPLEVFASAKFPSYEHLNRAHVFGCPVYVLDPKLQDGKKLPKWSPRCRRGQYLGPSPDHSSTIGRILNLRTGHISPQFHCIYDDLFSTVPNAETGGIQDETHFHAMNWERLVEAGSERRVEVEYDDRGHRLPLPELADEWLSPAERRLRALSRQQRSHRRTARQPLRAVVRPGPDSAPEGEVAPDDDAGGEVEAGTIPAPEPPVATDPKAADPSLAITGDDDDDDDDRSIVSMPEDIDADGFPPLEDDDEGDGTPDDSDEYDYDTEPEDPDEPLGRGRRRKRRNRRYFNDDFMTSDKPAPRRAPRSALNRQYLNSLNWERALSAIRSNSLKSMIAQMQTFTDPDDGTLDWMNPMIFGAKANADDNPTWEQAMNGPDADGYWKACKTEVNTLQEDKKAWDVVKREPWMNVLPSTWAFKCKRYPDGTVRKLKARFCVRGDKQIEGVDYFETFAPVVNWTTVRLMLILSIVLGLATRQVDYTAAFVHAPIDRDPGWDDLTPEEQERQGVYIDMPRGFSKPGKVLKLRRSLYGLKQSPRNFFQFLKGKLEDIGFKSAEDVDPCLFISPKVICLVYVDDTLFYSPKQEWIDEAIQQLRDEGMDLESEEDVAGFLGVHIERNEADGSVKLTQKGLIKRIVEALEIEHLYTKKTPATAKPLVLDEDGDPPDGSYNYASVVGMLQYLQAHSRPDITYAVSQCARFTHRTRRSHEEAVERIGQYLKGTMDEGLILRPSGEFNIDCYVDADFAGLWPYEDKQDPSCVKSRTGFVICIANCPVIWSSKLQTDIATSTMEAEYNGLSMAMRDLLPFKRLFLAVARAVGLAKDVFTKFNTTVWEDNNGALALAKLEAGRMTPRSKHYAVKYHWFRSHLAPNSVEVEKIATDEQKADIFTKGLTWEKFREIRRLLCGW